MITSKEVFARRKEGALDEAYRMALELMGSPQVGDWDRKAFCWCLIDLIKRDAKMGNQEHLAHYRRQLESIEADPYDDVLAKGVRNALALCNPHGQQISRAKELSKSGRHAESVAEYRKVCAGGSADTETQTSYGWELYRHAKVLADAEKVNLDAVKRNLNAYLKLDVDRPSLLHSCILQLAAKLAAQDNFSILAFSRLWNLKHLRPEDFDRFRAQDGKEFPSLAEKVVQSAGKEAASISNPSAQQYILPYLDEAIERFPDNIWLKLDKAKVLLSLGLHDDAMGFGLLVARAKVNDFWVWDLLGEIVSPTDRELALACYCKALSCQADDKFTGKIRLKLASYMAESGDLAAAKCEVESVVRSKEIEGHKIPDAAAQITAQPWYAETQANASNLNYYQSRCSAAEALLFSELPWIEANMGDKVAKPGGEGKPKRTIFLKTSSVPTEVRVPASKLGPKKYAPGDPVRVKGEFDADQRFQFYVIEPRDAQASWDVFPEKVGVVDHVNKDKHVLHFIVDREIDGVIPLSTLSDAFVEGDSISVRLSRHSSKKGMVYRVQQAHATDSQPGEWVKKVFSEEVRVSNGMGFTESDIFVSPPLVEEHRIEDGQKVSGTAVLNYNKKRSCWGWKAILIDRQ